MFWIIVIIIVIIVFIVTPSNSTSQPKPNTTRRKSPFGYTTQRKGPFGNAGAVQHMMDVCAQSGCSLDSTSPMSYGSFLSQVQRVIEYVALRSYCSINVVVIVQKINNTYCQISGQLLADTSFQNIHFGNGLAFDGDDCVSFQTDLATGFSSLEAVKQEMLLQFHWNDVIVSDEKFTMLDRGDFANKPYISYSFTVKKA